MKRQRSYNGDDRVHKRRLYYNQSWDHSYFNLIPLELTTMITSGLHKFWRSEFYGAYGGDRIESQYNNVLEIMSHGLNVVKTYFPETCFTNKGLMHQYRKKLIFCAAYTNNIQIYTYIIEHAHKNTEDDYRVIYAALGGNLEFFRECGLVPGKYLESTILASIVSGSTNLLTYLINRYVSNSDEISYAGDILNICSSLARYEMMDYIRELPIFRGLTINHSRNLSYGLDTLSEIHQYSRCHEIIDIEISRLINRITSYLRNMDISEFELNVNTNLIIIERLIESYPSLVTYGFVKRLLKRSQIEAGKSTVSIWFYILNKFVLPAQTLGIVYNTLICMDMGHLTKIGLGMLKWLYRKGVIRTVNPFRVDQLHEKIKLEVIDITEGEVFETLYNSYNKVTLDRNKLHEIQLIYPKLKKNIVYLATLADTSAIAGDLPIERLRPSEQSLMVCILHYRKQIDILKILVYRLLFYKCISPVLNLIVNMCMFSHPPKVREHVVHDPISSTWSLIEDIYNNTTPGLMYDSEVGVEINMFLPGSQPTSIRTFITDQFSKVTVSADGYENYIRNPIMRFYLT